MGVCMWARFAIMLFHALIIPCSSGRLKWHLWLGTCRFGCGVDFSAKITCFRILKRIFVWETIIQNIQRNPIRTTRSTLLFFIRFFFSLIYCMESTMTIVCGCDVIFLLVTYCIISVGLYRDSSIMFSLLCLCTERSMTCSSLLLSPGCAVLLQPYILRLIQFLPKKIIVFFLWWVRSLVAIIICEMAHQSHLQRNADSIMNVWLLLPFLWREHVFFSFVALSSRHFCLLLLLPLCCYCFEPFISKKSGPSQFHSIVHFNQVILWPEHCD